MPHTFMIQRDLRIGELDDAANRKNDARHHSGCHDTCTSSAFVPRANNAPGGS